MGSSYTNKESFTDFTPPSHPLLGSAAPPTQPTAAHTQAESGRAAMPSTRSSTSCGSEPSPAQPALAASPGPRCPRRLLLVSRPLPLSACTEGSQKSLGSPTGCGAAGVAWHSTQAAG